MELPYYVTWSRQRDAAILEIDSAEGDEWIMPGGSRVYDFLSTSFQANFGHANPWILDRVRRQMESLSIAHPKADFPLKRRATDKLLKLLGREAGRIFFTVSGAESIENALKIAREFTGRKNILARRKSYHGASLGALSVTGDWRNAAHCTFDEGTIRIPEPADDPGLEQTRAIVERAGPEKIAGVILETITGANGVIKPPADWYAGIRSLCDDYGLLLILDEVLCGFGRTGPPFAYQHDWGVDLRPDMICLSKGISGGYIPLGALWTTPQIADYYADSTLACGLTNYAHPLGLAAMEAVIDLLGDEAFQKNWRASEQLFGDLVAEFGELPFVEEVRCYGMLAAVELAFPAPSWEEAIEAGLHFLSRGSMAIFAPPLVTRPERLQSAWDTFRSLVAASPAA